MSSYATHNVNANLVRHYSCEIDEARKIETAIKLIFKGNVSSTSKEWFSVAPEIIDKYVYTLLVERPIKNNILPSAHGVMLTSVAAKHQETLLHQIENENINEDIKEGIKKYTTRCLIAEHFASCFSLGIPDHKLQEELIVIKDFESVDKDYCKLPKTSPIVQNAIHNNYIAFPKDDHIWHFFHLVRLATGHFVAICTARVSMPYLAAIEDNGCIQEIVDLANEFGWMCK